MERLYVYTVYKHNFLFFIVLVMTPQSRFGIKFYVINKLRGHNFIDATFCKIDFFHTYRESWNYRSLNEERK